MNIQVEFNIPATMRDGTFLRANIFRPVEDGTYPVALTRTPYSKDFSSVDDCIRMASAGYIVVMQDVRGRFASEGHWDPFVNEANDGYDSVEWAAQLPGSNGNVGMFGASYVGFTQWSAASQNPPHLKAIMPAVTWADARDGVVWRGGAFELGTFASWQLLMGLDEIGKRIADLPPAEQMQAMGALVYQINHLRTEGYGSLPLKDFAPLRQLNLAADQLDLAISRPNERASVMPYSPAEFYDRLTIPAYNLGGWYDVFTKGTFQNYTARPGRSSKLLIGPWIHGTVDSVVGEMDFGFIAGAWINMQFDLTGLTQRWFDYWLKGIENGILQEPPIKIFVMGDNIWRDEHEWPLARAEYKPLYLHAESKLNFEPPAATEAADRYTYDPADPTPTSGGSLLMHRLFTPGVRDQRNLEQRADLLSFTTGPFDKDMEVTGPVLVKLWAMSDARDTDFVARLIDVHPDGFAQNVCDGIVRARYRNGEQPELIQPGQIYEYTIDLWETSNVFKAGHRLRLDIASASFPRWDRNPNTGEDFGKSTAMQAAHQTILHDAAHPSHIILPIIPR